MGRIFTPKEVELKLVPTLSDFTVFVNLLKWELAGCEGVIGALICGSVARGCHNVRSDVDCLVLYTPESEELIIRILADLYDAAKKMHIPLGIIRLSSDLASTKMHHISRGFADHMSKVVYTESVVKTNPLVFLNLNNSDLVEDTEDYLRFKLRQLEKFQVERQSISEDMYYSGLSKITASTIHVARKVILCLDRELNDDSSPNVRKIYPNYVGSELASVFYRLVQVDRQYSLKLPQHLRKFDRSDYEAIVQDIDDLLPVFIKFVRANALMFA